MAVISKSQLLLGRVMHKRLLPKVHGFTYAMYYLALNLADMAKMPVPHNRFGLFSFFDRDHGPRDGGNLESWMRDLLARKNLSEADGEIWLFTLPRILGYVFNPVSFWLCYDKTGQLRAVLCEVNNTFGEYHNYICMHQDHRPIRREDWLTGEKAFHVSPFLEREGTYRFRFHRDERLFGAWIDHYDVSGRQKLLTSLNGRLQDLTAASMRKVFWHYPLITLKAIVLIHWQALRLVMKGFRYVPKPLQREERLTSAEDYKNVTPL